MSARTDSRILRRYVRLLRAAKRQDPARYRAEIRKVTRNAMSLAWAYDPEIRRDYASDPWGFDMVTARIMFGGIMEARRYRANA